MSYTRSIHERKGSRHNSFVHRPTDLCVCFQKKRGVFQSFSTSPAPAPSLRSQHFCPASRWIRGIAGFPGVLITLIGAVSRTIHTERKQIEQRIIDDFRTSFQEELKARDEKLDTNLKPVLKVSFISAEYIL